MSRLFVGPVNEGPDKGKYAICFKDGRGDLQVHGENWKPQVFETEEKANAKLSALEAERESEDSAKPLSIEEATAFVCRQNWKFASTYAKTAPHEYLVKRWLSEEDKILFECFVQTMKRNFVVGYFYGHKNDYLILGDHYYWFMGQHENRAINLINRTTTDYLSFENGVYVYKGKDSQ